MASVGLGCATTRTSRNANSAEDDNEEEEAAQESEESEQAEAAEQDGEGDEKAQEESRPVKKRRPKRRRHVQRTPEPEPAPIARAQRPPPPPVGPPPEDPAPAYSDSAVQGDDALEAEARQRCRWKKVAPYRPDWANSISPPLAQQRKITSKPICPYGTPPAVLRVARQIAVQQTKLNKR
jgi:hypothetical protein